MNSEIFDLLKQGIKNPITIPAFLKNRIKRGFVDLTWDFWRRLGFVLLVDHHYVPVPDFENIRKKEPWNNPFPEAGIDFKEEAQLNRISQFGKYRDEFGSYTGFAAHGDRFILYSMIREHSPSKIIEVGGGTSTQIMLDAVKENDDNQTEILSIEPYPDEDLKQLASNDNRITIRESAGQDVDVETYSQIQSGDVLFIDTTHTISTANETVHLFLRVLPELPDGAIIHIHDIYLPSDYSERAITSRHEYWTEQYLVHAFLLHNDKFEILWAGNYMSQNHRDELESVLPRPMDNPFLGSLWIRRIK